MSALVLASLSQFLACTISCELVVGYNLFGYITLGSIFKPPYVRISLVMNSLVKRYQCIEGKYNIVFILCQV